LVTRRDKVIGGHDRCNGWGLADQPGMIVSDAQECPRDPMRDAYWLLATGREASRTRAGSQLIARTPGHAAIFRRSLAAGTR
jgi:phage terminase large subunit-like protein